MAARVFLQQLFPYPGGEVVVSNIDIILIHGVNGDPIKTWEHVSSDGSGKRVLWPRDLLPKDFPAARVLSFGYNGDIYRNDSVAGIRDLARSLLSYLSIKRRGVDSNRPILFIAHCLGGLIVKQALHTAHYERDYTRVALETAGIFFFGTPHCSTREDKWDHTAKAFSPLDKPSGWRRRSRLVQVLRQDSDALIDLMHRFRQLMLEGNGELDEEGKPVLRYKIVNFYETQQWSGAKACIVDKTAAQLQVTGEKLFPVDADHAGMCRFPSDENDPAFAPFKVLCQQIDELLDDVAKRVSTAPTRAGIDGRQVDVHWTGTDKLGRRIQFEGKVTVEGREERRLEGRDKKLLSLPSSGSVAVVVEAAGN